MISIVIRHLLSMFYSWHWIATRGGMRFASITAIAMAEVAPPRGLAVSFRRSGIRRLGGIHDGGLGHQLRTRF